MPFSGEGFVALGVSIAIIMALLGSAYGMGRCRRVKGKHSRQASYCKLNPVNFSVGQFSVTEF